MRQFSEGAGGSKLFQAKNFLVAVYLLSLCLTIGSSTEMPRLPRTLMQNGSTQPSGVRVPSQLGGIWQTIIPSPAFSQLARVFQPLIWLLKFLVTWQSKQRCILHAGTCTNSHSKAGIMMQKLVMSRSHWRLAL